MKLMKKVWILTVLSVSFFTAALAQTDTTLKEFTGNFTFPQGSIINSINIVYGDSSLTYTSDRENGLLIKEKADTFFTPAHSGTAFFIRDGQKRITGIIIDVMGYHLVGIKDSHTQGTMLNPHLLFKKEDAAIKDDKSVLARLPEQV
jgi:hypothetical protein